MGGEGREAGGTGSGCQGEVWGGRGGRQGSQGVGVEVSGMV